jgi:ferric-dicitrate binding protein FerR (iron transport regulator)
MLEKNNILPDYDLLAKYFAGECSNAEKESIENWIKYSAENKKSFDKMYFIWKESTNVLLKNQINVDSAWNKMQKRISSENIETENRIKRDNQIETRIKREFRIDNRIKRVIQIAAVVVIVLFLRYIIPLFLNDNNYLSEITKENTKELILSDSSILSLSANSEIKYPKKFDKEKRIVKLEGEAFFKITPNPYKPFVIETDFAKIQVLGTSFNVENFDTSKYVKVTVVSGSVLFSNVNKNPEQIVLKKGEAAIIEKSSGKIIELENVDSNKYFTKTKTLIFKKTELYVVAQTLSQAYQTNIEIENNEIKSCRLTATFRNAELSEILLIIGNTLNVEIKSENEKHIISGTACESN